MSELERLRLRVVELEQALLLVMDLIEKQCQHCQLSPPALVRLELVDRVARSATSSVDIF